MSGIRPAGDDFLSPRTSPLANGFRRAARAMAAGVPLSREMRICGRGFWGAVGFLGLIVLGRGQYTVTSAYADLDAGAIWDDPQTLDVTDINALVSLAIPFADPTREAKEWLTGALPRHGRVLTIRGGRRSEPGGPVQPNESAARFLNPETRLRRIARNLNGRPCGL